MDSYDIKRATPKYLNKIVELAKQGNVFRYHKLFYAILVAFGWIYVMVKDNCTIGYICYTPIPLANKVFVIQVCVEESCRGRGLGGQLLDFICDEVRRRYNVNTVLAHTLKPRVVKLFKRKSWKIIADILGVVFIRKKSYQ